MSRRTISLDELGALFDEASSSIERVEAQPTYGERVPASQSYLDEVAQHDGAGIRRARVRVIAPEPGPYEAWELEALAANARAGEHVLVHVAARPVVSGRTDFWLFDRAVGVLMDYAPDGELLTLTRVDDPGEVDDLAWMFDFLARGATPLAEHAAAAVRRAG